MSWRCLTRGEKGVSNSTTPVSMENINLLDIGKEMNLRLFGGFFENKR